MDYELSSYSSRIIASIIDSLLFFIAPMLIVYPFLENISIEALDKLFLIFLLLYFLKDTFGRSPGKYFLGLRVINKNKIKKANQLKLILRNITLLLGIIDWIFVLINNNRQRLGDIIASTIVVKEIRQQKELPKIEVYEGNTKENIECVNCGNILEENEDVCNKCGWTYK